MSTTFQFKTKTGQYLINRFKAT